MGVQTKRQVVVNLKLAPSPMESENELHQLPQGRMDHECYLWTSMGDEPDFLFPWQSRECQDLRVFNYEGSKWLLEKMSFLLGSYGDNKKPFPECVDFSLHFIGQRLNSLLKQCWEVAKARCDRQKKTDSECSVIITYDDYFDVMSKDPRQFLEQPASNGLHWTSIEEKRYMVKPGGSLMEDQEGTEAEPFLRFLGKPPMEKRVLKILDTLAHHTICELTAMASLLRDYEEIKGHPYGNRSAKSSSWIEDASWIEFRHYRHASRINKRCATRRVMDAIIEALEPRNRKTRKGRSKTAGFRRKAIQKTKRS